MTDFNAILIAAGRGSRLQGFTEERPKCMVTVDDRSILHYLTDALDHPRIDQLHIVRGYLRHQLTVPGATYHHNRDWPHNNILHSLFCARQAMAPGFVSTYSDIIYPPEVVDAAIAALNPRDTHIALVVDRQWASTYVDRQDHPIAQAELVEVRGDRVTAVGKHVGPDEAIGEFIGLAAHSATGARWMRQAFEALESKLDADDPFRHGRPFRLAYLADLYEALIECGHPISWVPIDGGWREIDTVEDLASVRQDWPLLSLTSSDPRHD